jgi:hypothetical protein
MEKGAIKLPPEWQKHLAAREEARKRGDLDGMGLTEEQKAVWKKHAPHVKGGILTWEQLEKLVQHEREWAGFQRRLAAEKFTKELMDGLLAAVRSGKQPKNDALFCAAAGANDVPDEIIALMIAVAKATEVPKPLLIPGTTHAYCEQWVDAFTANLNKALNDKGYKNGLVDATKGGVKLPPYKVWYRVPDFPFDQDHTVLEITLKDGTIWFIDCGTLSAQDINNLTRGRSHFCPDSAVPKGWTQYPRTPPPPPPPKPPFVPVDPEYPKFPFKPTW